MDYQMMMMMKKKKKKEKNTLKCDWRRNLVAWS